MKSRMSCCNGAVLKRTLFRGLPLWGTYLLCWLIAMPVVILSNGNYQETVYLREYVLEAAAGSCNLVNFFYGLAAACMVSSYLYKSRSANFFGALPLRRENLFLTQYTGGLLFAVLPNLVICVLTLLAGSYWSAGMLTECAVWFAAQILAFAFYYSFAMFCAMIVGNLIALPLMYGMLNFSAILAEVIVRELLEVFVHGAWFQSEFYFDWASPLFYVLSSGKGPEVRSNWVNETFHSVTFYSWDLLLIYGAVGVGFALLAFFIHKHRRMEAASDVIAVRHLKPVFLYGFTAGCSLCIGYLLSAVILQGTGKDAFVSTLLCMLVGAFIGYFVGQMLLHRSVRVFRSRYLANYGVVAVVIVALMLCVRFDLFGYSAYVPQVQEISGVSIGYNYQETVSQDPALIEKTVRAHKQLMREEPGQEAWNCRTAYLTYHMKDGRVVRRSYEVACSEEVSKDPGSAIRVYEALYNDPDYMVIRHLGTDFEQRDILYCSIYNNEGKEVFLNEAQAWDFLKTCVVPDLRETTMGMDEYSGRDVRAEDAGVYIGIEFENSREENGKPEVVQYMHLCVTEDAQRILACVASMGVPAVK